MGCAVAVVVVVETWRLGDAHDLRLLVGWGIWRKWMDGSAKPKLPQRSWDLGSARLGGIGLLREVFIIITCCLIFWPRGWHNTRAQVLEYGTGREVLSLWWFG